MNFHIYMTISATEKSTDKELEGMFEGKAHEIRASLATMKAKGMEVIPSAGCDNRDAKGYCLGHDVDPAKQEGGGMTDLYDLGHQHAYAGQQPAEELRDQPYYMHGYNDGRRDYDRYRDLRDEGYSRYQAMVMAGMRDPAEACE